MKLSKLSELNWPSHQSEVHLLVGRGLLECDSLLVKDHVGVTNVCAIPDHRRCGNCVEVELA